MKCSSTDVKWIFIIPVLHAVWADPEGVKCVTDLIRYNYFLSKKKKII